jgi:hypothetical protein
LAVPAQIALTSGRRSSRSFVGTRNGMPAVGCRCSKASAVDTRTESRVPERATSGRHSSAPTSLLCRSSGPGGRRRSGSGRSGWLLSSPPM